MKTPPDCHQQANNSITAAISSTHWCHHTSITAAAASTSSVDDWHLYIQHHQSAPLYPALSLVPVFVGACTFDTVIALLSVLKPPLGSSSLTLFLQYQIPMRKSKKSTSSSKEHGEVWYNKGTVYSTKSCFDTPFLIVTTMA